MIDIGRFLPPYERRTEKTEIEFQNIGKLCAACAAEEKDDVSHFVINIPQECLVAKCGGDVRIYKYDGVYSFHCIFADYAILFELEEKEALKLIQLMEKEQSLNKEKQENFRL